jgi:DNA-damage-inducible protein J
MVSIAFIRAKIDEKAKNEAADMGSMIPDEEKALSSEMRVPNALTAATLKKSERGKDVHHAEDAEDLFRQLGI